jgi:hypothetical protein
MDPRLVSTTPLRQIVTQEGKPAIHEVLYRGLESGAGAALHQTSADSQRRTWPAPATAHASMPSFFSL